MHWVKEIDGVSWIMTPNIRYILSGSGYYKRPVLQQLLIHQDDFMSGKGKSRKKWIDITLASEEGNPHD